MDRTPSQTNVMEVGDQSALDFFDAVLSRLSRLPARERASAGRSLYRSEVVGRRARRFASSRT